MRLTSRLSKAESLAESVYVAAGVAATREQDKIVQEYLASLTLEELIALEAATIWKDADPRRMAELGKLSPNELIALYQQELRNSGDHSNGGGVSR